MITVDKLTKTFKRKTSKHYPKYEMINAVNNLDLNIKKGEIFGIIGPNGAGKTTTVKILSTLIIPDSGTATIAGYDVVNNKNIVKNKIGFLTGEYNRSFYWRLSGFRNLEFFAKLRGIRNPKNRINELIEMFNLNDQQNELVMKYSTGMKHKLALAVALLHDPPVLFLDEPLTGIDPMTANEIKNIVKQKFKDKTIIWTSHNLYEIQEICDRIALINKGRIVLQGEPETLSKEYWDHTKILINSDKPEDFSSFDISDIKGKTIEIKTKEISKTISEVTNFARLNNIKIFDIKTIRPSLEEIFMEVIKKDV